MPTPGKAIPEGYHSLTPHIIVKDAAAAIEWYKNAFGAQELFRMPGPDGKTVMHAEVKIGDSNLMMCSENKEMGSCAPSNEGGSSVTIALYVEDCDAVYNKAIEAGAKSTMPLQDMFWGDRYGKLTDPFGHNWSVATHKLDLTPEEMKTACDEAMKQMAAQAQA